MKFPTLFKKTSTGAIQQWEIEVTHNQCGFEGEIGAGRITTRHGQVGSKNIQEIFDIIENGKNIGKVNETTPLQQAELEAKAKHEKQLKKGYVDSIEKAQKGEVDEIIEGGINPMLAFTFEKQGKKIKYPCLVQPKLDGIRMIAVVKDHKCTLWSRTRKPINSLPHIVEEIEKHFLADVILDGEAYSDEFKDNFEHIVHLVRQDNPDSECTDVHYHIYDTVEYATHKTGTFQERNEFLYKAFNIGKPQLKYLKRVETSWVENEGQVADFYNLFKNQGYEGAILRNSSGLYVGKRSPDLIKVKEMQDAEFKIVGIEEGRGKLSGHVGAFVCMTDDGKEFKAKMAGETAKLKEFFEKEELWLNKLLTVQFQDMTNDGVPRFPVGKAIRDYD